MNKFALSEGQSEALQDILRRSMAGLLAGGALRSGYEVLRQSNPRYDPPKVQQPVIISVPRPVPAGQATPQLSAIPAFNRMLPAADPKKDEKRATDNWLQENLPKGLYNLIPNVTPLQGAPGATSGADIPLAGAGMAIGVGGGAYAGYHLADKMLRAADRRRARADLEAAQREFQEATVGKARNLQFPHKQSADMGKLIDGGEPTDPIVVRIKRAMDRAFAASQILGSTAGLPPATSAPSMISPTLPPPPNTKTMGAIGQPSPASVASTSMPAIPAINGSGATESIPSKQSDESQSQLANFLTGWLYPGTMGSPSAARTNMLLAGGAGLGGAYLGYQHARDKEQAEKTRRMIRSVDKANATAIPAPMIAQMIPVAQQA